MDSLRNLCGKGNVAPLHQIIFVVVYTLLLVGGLLLLGISPWGSAEAWSAIAAWVAILVNIAGLLFIWLQLKSNQGTLRASVRSADAAAAAARTALLDSRAWVKADIVLGGVNQSADGRVQLTLRVSLTNVGKTPALHVTYRAGQIDHGGDAKAQISALLGTGPLAGVTLFPGESNHSERVVSIGWTHQSEIVGVNVQYRLPTGEVCETPAMFVLFLENNALQFRPGIQEDLYPT